MPGAPHIPKKSLSPCISSWDDATSSHRKAPKLDHSFRLLPRLVRASFPRTGNRCGCQSADMRVRPGRLPASCATGERRSAGIPVRLRTPAPHCVQQARVGNRQAGIRHEIAQEVKFFRRKVNRLAGLAHEPAGRVEFYFSDMDDGVGIDLGNAVNAGWRPESALPAHEC